MDKRQLAAILFIAMPTAMWLRSLVYFVLWLILVRQRTHTRYGFWLNVFMGMHVILAVQFALLVTYFMIEADRSRFTSYGFQEWGLLSTLSTIPVVASFVAAMVVKYSVADEAEVNRVDERQREQQDILDKTSLENSKTSLINTKRGQKLSEAWFLLDKRTNSMIKREHDQDVKDSK